MKREAPEIMVARCLFASLLCAVFSAGAVMGAANAQTAGDPSAMVWCLDVERALVTRKQAWRCKGRVIDAKEAEQIKLRRIRRIRGRIKNPGPLFKGTRLSGSGTGFFVSPHGHVVTNHHVVDGCKSISFTPAGSGRLVGELLASDERKDLALLRVPLITVIALAYAGLLEGSVLTETVFSWPGLGRYITSSLLNADMNAVLGGTLVVGAVFVLVNQLADFLYRLADPRIA